ncbi:MAG: hypothetical protein ACREEX_09415, partial [Caulobacteraceae bacterium]
MKAMLVAVASTALLAAGAAAGTAKADPALVGAPYLQPVQFSVYFWAGHRYCWYYEGWRGPGWYWCGFP